jgi:hypothetical protein
MCAPLHPLENNSKAKEAEALAMGAKVGVHALPGAECMRKDN